MVSFFRVALLTSLVVVCLLPDLWAASSDNSWIVDTALPSLLRFNLKGEVVSSDLSEYIKFTCHGVGKDKTCSIDDSNTDLTDMNKLLEPSSSDSIQSYGTGVALYFFIAVLGAILVILGTLLYIIFFCGFDFFCLTTCFKRKAVFRKNARQICALIFLALFFAFLVAVIVLCYTRGITTAFDGVSETSDAPEGFATVAYRMSTALMPTYVAILGSVVVPTLRVLNSTINEVVNYEDVVNDLEVLNSTVGQLPNIDVILGVLDNIDQGIADLNADITGVLSDYTHYQDATAEVTASTDVLIADLRSINASLETIGEDLVLGQAVTQDLADLYVTFFGSGGPESYSPADTDGLVDSIQRDIYLLRRNDSAGEGIPTIPTCEAAEVNISRLLVSTPGPVTLDGKPGEIRYLSEQLHGIYDSMRLLPNYTVTGQHLITLNDTVRESLAADGIIDQMSTFLTTLNTDLSNLPNTTLIGVHAKTLFAQVNDINTASVYSHVLSMNSTVATLPAQVDILITEADKISGLILSIIPPLYDLLVVQAEGFNRTIMATPVNTRKIFNNINKTIHEAADAADKFLPQLRDLQDNFSDDLDVSSYLSLINSFQGEIDTNLASIDENAILAGIASASVGDVFNATAALESLEQVQRVLKKVSISEDAIDKLNKLESARYALELALERVVADVGDVSSAGVPVTEQGDYWKLAQGVCDNDMSVYCDDDSVCGTGTCVENGKYRCTAPVGSTTVLTNCVVDATCDAVHAGTYCLNDNVRVAYIQYVLDKLSDPNTVPDLSDLNDELDEIRASAASMDVASIQADLAAVQSSIDSANTVQYEESLQTLKDSIVDTSTDFDGIIDEVETSQNLINDVDISDYTDQLQDVQDRIDQYGDKIGEYMTLVKDLESYIFSDQGLNKRFASLETASLQASMDDRGFGQTLLYTGQVIEDTMGDVLDILKNNSFGTKGVEITNRLREPARYMDRLTGNEHVGFVDIYTVGSLYYLLQMSNASADYQVLAHDPMQKLVLTDINGDRYPDNKYCVTKRCFENQQEDLEDNYGTYLPLILIPLAVVCLIAIANVLCLFNPTDNAGGKLFCSRFLMCFIIVIVPWYLVFSGLIFAFTIAASDGCSSGPKIAANYVSAMGDDLCLKLDGNGTLTECRFKGNGVDITMDLQAMTDAIIGTGQCSSDAEDPFYTPLHSLADQLRNITDDKVGDVVNGKSLKRFRQPLKDIILDSSGSGATVMTEFIESVGYQVLTCDNLSSMLQSFKEPVCYTSVGSWAWLVSCIYLASWCMCCMGIPAACALKNHYRLTMLEEIEEAITNKKGAAKKQFLTQLAMARRGRGLLARKFHKKALYVDHDVEMSAMDTSGSYDGGSGGGGSGYVYATVSQDEDDRRAPVPVHGNSSDPAEGKITGFFAKYPKVSSKQNVMGSSVHSMSAHSDGSVSGSAAGSPVRGGNRGSGGYAAVADESKAEEQGGEGSDDSSDYGELQESSVMQVNTYRSEV